jgi:phosphate starvation-inducible protein PhoH
MSGKRKTKKDEQIEFLENSLINNVIAIKETGKRRQLTIHDLKTITPLTEPQRQMMESYMMGNHILAEGSAGVGKSYIALWLALNSILSPNTKQDKIIILRSAVASRNVGFLPGSIEEKMEPYENPYRDIVANLMGKETCYDEMKKNGKIVFMPTSYLRGMTWDNAIVIMDEIQSMNLHELNSVITRCGRHTKLIAIGDNLQNDLIYNKYDQTGLPTFMNIIRRMKEFDIIKFTKDDVVRSALVRSWIHAYEDEMNGVAKP